MNERVRIGDVFEYGRHAGSDKFIRVSGAGRKRVMYFRTDNANDRGWVTRAVALRNIREGYWRRYDRRTGIVDGGPWYSPRKARGFVETKERSDGDG